jgi:hypothetical protein
LPARIPSLAKDAFILVQNYDGCDCGRSHNRHGRAQSVLFRLRALVALPATHAFLGLAKKDVDARSAREGRALGRT